MKGLLVSVEGKAALFGLLGEIVFNLVGVFLSLRDFTPHLLVIASYPKLLGRQCIQHLIHGVYLRQRALLVEQGLLAVGFDAKQHFLLLPLDFLDFFFDLLTTADGTAQKSAQQQHADAEADEGEERRVGVEHDV